MLIPISVNTSLSPDFIIFFLVTLACLKVVAVSCVEVQVA
jgi:hypothetical protein